MENNGNNLEITCFQVKNLAIALPTYYSYFLALQLLRIIATS